MRQEKHQEVLNEVLEEIQSALNDQRGLVSHQRRLAFSLSLDAITLLEMYLHKLDILKESSKINHIWFKRKKETIFEYLSNQIVSPINPIEQINEIIDLIVNPQKNLQHLCCSKGYVDFFGNLKTQNKLHTLVWSTKTYQGFVIIEEKRDDLAYGSPATEEILQEKINLFFKLKTLAKC